MFLDVVNLRPMYVRDNIGQKANKVNMRLYLLTRGESKIFFKIK